MQHSTLLSTVICSKSINSNYSLNLVTSGFFSGTAVVYSTSLSPSLPIAYMQLIVISVLIKCSIYVLAKATELPAGGNFAIKGKPSISVT